MGQPRKPDYETLSLFLVLGVLTVILVLGIKWVLFVPNSAPSRVPTEIQAERP